MCYIVVCTFLRQLKYKYYNTVLLFSVNVGKITCVDLIFFAKKILFTAFCVRVTVRIMNTAVCLMVFVRTQAEDRPSQCERYGLVLLRRI